VNDIALLSWIGHWSSFGQRSSYNGELTLGENIADDGGVQLTYQAMLANGEEKSIDLQE
jgi:predicted metalloendopeptidase